MKFTKTLAAIAAASLAVSSLAVSAFAANITSNSAIDLASDDKADAVIKLYEEDKDHNPVVDLFTEKNIARSDIYGMKVYFDLTADQVNGEEWIGGGIGANSDSTSWLSVEWGQAAGKKPIALAEDGTVTWLQETPVFADTDTYCQLWTQSWGIDLTLEKMEVLDKDGKPIAAISDVEEEPADDAEEVKADIAYTDGLTPSYTYTVKGDAKELNVKVAVSPADGDAFGWNDWCGAGVAVKSTDGTVKYYQYGGKSVNWDWGNEDLDVTYSEKGIDGETWLGTVDAENGGEFAIPVQKDDVVEFYCLSWDKYTGVQYTLTLSEVAEDVDPNPGESSGEVPEPGDTEKPAEPGDSDKPVEPGDSNKPADDNKKPVSPDTGVAVAVVPAAVAAAAVAAAGIVLKKRSK